MMKCLDLDPNDDAEVFGGPVRTNTDYETDFIPGDFGGFRPRVRVVVLPLGGIEDSETVFPGQRPYSFGNVFNILRSLLGNRYWRKQNTFKTNKNICLKAITGPRV